MNWDVSVFASERVKECVSMCVCLFRGVITLGMVDSAKVMTKTKLEINRQQLGSSNTYRLC